jgi:hypothetical protein
VAPDDDVVDAVLLGVVDDGGRRVPELHDRLDGTVVISALHRGREHLVTSRFELRQLLVAVGRRRVCGATRENVEEDQGRAREQVDRFVERSARLFGFVEGDENAFGHSGRTRGPRHLIASVG